MLSFSIISHQASLNRPPQEMVCYLIKLHCLNGQDIPKTEGIYNVSYTLNL